MRAFGLVPGAVVHRVFTHPPRLRTPLVPRSLAERHDVVTTEVGGGRVATVTPADAYDHVFFLHGGAYTLQAQHWPFLGRLVRRGYAVSLVDYPLAPEHTVDETAADGPRGLGRGRQPRAPRPDGPRRCWPGTPPAAGCR